MQIYLFSECIGFLAASKFLMLFPHQTRNDLNLLIAITFKETIFM